MNLLAIAKSLSVFDSVEEGLLFDFPRHVVEEKESVAADDVENFR